MSEVRVTYRFLRTEARRSRGKEITYPAKLSLFPPRNLGTRVNVAEQPFCVRSGNFRSYDVLFNRNKLMVRYRNMKNQKIYKNVI